MSNNFIRTFTGRRLHIPPAPEEIFIEDIAHGLVAQPRFGGQTMRPYSVVAHCIHVARMLPPKLKLAGLLHDGSEGFMCDLPRPIKRLLPDYEKLQEQVMQAIAVRFNLEWPLPDIIKQADNAALYLERQALFEAPITVDDQNTPPASSIVRVPPPVSVEWSFERWLNKTPKELEELFLDHFVTYTQYQKYENLE